MHEENFLGSWLEEDGKNKEEMSRGGRQRNRRRDGARRG